jgi:hypothetical protein
MLASTWLKFVFLAVASFAPVGLGLRSGWWVPYYYGALFVSWVLLSTVAERRAAREDQEDQMAEYELTRSAREYWAATNAEAAARQARGEERLIVVARNGGDLYDRLRGDQPADEAVRIITDRRSADRRRQLEVYIPDRRGGERRRHNIDSLLLTQGWAEVTLPERN